MKKNFKVAFVGAIGAMLMLAGCAKDYSSDINALDDRVTAVEGSVADLKAKISAGAVITSVTPADNGVKVTLSNGQSFDITNGKDGKDGKDGKNGSVVDVNDEGYWTIDGKSIGLKAEGKDGQDGKPGKDGKDGEDGKPGKDGKDGQNGKDGKDANYWMPDVEKNAWVEYSADGKATGKTIEGLLPEGAVSAIVANDVLILTNVDGVKGGMVEISLKSDLKSLAMIPDTIFDGYGQVCFKYLFQMKDKDGKLVAVSSSPATVQYRSNPSNANFSGVSYRIENRSVYTRGAEAKEDGNVEILAYPKAPNKKGILEFDLRATDVIALPDHQKSNRQFAIVADVEGEDIMSDFAYAYTGEVISTYVIGHKRLSGGKPVLYRTEYIEKDQPTDSSFCKLYEPTLYYKDTIDLKKFVEVYLSADSKETLAKQDLPGAISYKFQLAGKSANREVYGPKAEYFGADGYTDQNKFVTLEEDGTMFVKEEFGISAVNRTPHVKVTAFYTEDGVEYTLGSAYIKVVVTDKEVAPTPVTDDSLYHTVMIKHHVDFKYENLTEDGSTYDRDYKLDTLKVNWEEVNKVILNQNLDLSFAEFKQLYKLDEVMTPKKVNNPAEGAAKWEYVPYAGDEMVKGTNIYNVSPEDWATSTNVLSFFVDKSVKAPSTQTVVLVYTLKDEADNYEYPNVAIEFSYTVTAPIPHEHTYGLYDMKLNPNYILGKIDKLNPKQPKAGYDPDFTSETETYAGVRVKGMSDELVNASAIQEHFEEYKSWALKNKCATLTFQIMNYANTEFQFVDVDNEGYEIVNNANGENGLKCSSVTLTKEQIDAIIKNEAKSPVIKYMKNNILGGTKADVLIQVTETCTELDKANKGYYYVEFNSVKVKVDLEAIELKTLKPNADNKTADTIKIDNIVTVTDGTKDAKTKEYNKLIEYKDGVWSVTDYAKETYKFTGSEEIKVAFKPYKGNQYINYKYDTEDSFGKNLNVVADENLIIWDNKGTDLQVRKFAEVTIIVTIGESEFTSDPAKVTILTTEESNK